MSKTLIIVGLNEFNQSGGGGGKKAGNKKGGGKKSIPARNKKGQPNSAKGLRPSKGGGLMGTKKRRK